MNADLETKLKDAVAERSYAEDIARAAEAKLAEAYRDWNTESKGLNGALAKAEYEARENHERAEAAEQRATDAQRIYDVDATIKALGDKGVELIAAIAALRVELAEAVRRATAFHRRAQKAEAETAKLPDRMVWQNDEIARLRAENEQMLALLHLHYDHLYAPDTEDGQSGETDV